MSDPIVQSFSLDGQRIEFDHTTRFRIETAKSTGKYKPKYVEVKSPAAAVSFFTGINLGDGFRKRLVMIHEGKEKTIARKAA